MKRFVFLFYFFVCALSAMAECQGGRCQPQGMPQFCRGGQCQPGGQCPGGRCLPRGMPRRGQGMQFRPGGQPGGGVGMAGMRPRGPMRFSRSPMLRSPFGQQTGFNRQPLGRQSFNEFASLRSQRPGGAPGLGQLAQQSPLPAPPGGIIQMPSPLDSHVAPPDAGGRPLAIVPPRTDPPKSLAGGASSRLQYNMVPQKTGVWCWAASIANVVGQYGVALSQEQVVQKYFGRVVNSAVSSPMAGQSLLQGILGNVPVRQTQRGLSAPELDQIFERGGKVIVWVGSPRQGHVMVLQGKRGNGQYILSDPFRPDAQLVSYGQLMATGYHASTIVDAPATHTTEGRPIDTVLTSHRLAMGSSTYAQSLSYALTQ